MTNSPTPLEKAVERVGTTLIRGAASTVKQGFYWHEDIQELLLAAKQLSTLRQNSVAKSVWDETHAKYLEVAAENEYFKSTIQLMEHGKYGRVDLTNQILELKSALEAMTKERDELKEDKVILLSQVDNGDVNLEQIKLIYVKQLESTRAENVKMREALQNCLISCEGHLYIQIQDTLSTIPPTTTDNSKEDVK